MMLLVLALWGLRTGRVAKLLEARMTQELYDACGVDARFVAFEIQPLSARLHLAGLEIFAEDGARLISVSQAFADLSVVQLLKGRIDIQELVLEQPFVDLRVREGRLVDLPHCVRTTPGEGGRAPLGIDEVQIVGARVGVELDDAQLDFEDVGAELWPDRRGGANLTFGVGQGVLTTQTSSQSGLSVPTLAGRVPLGPLELLAHLEGPALEPRSIELHRLQADLGGVGLDASGRADLVASTLDLEVFLQSSLGAIPVIVDGWPELSGAVDLSIHVQGSRAEPKLDLEADIAVVAIGRRHLGRSVFLRAQVDRSGLDIHELVAELERGAATVRGRVDFSPGFPVRLEADARGFSFAALMDALGNKGFWCDFTVTGTSQVQGQLSPFQLEGPFDFFIPSVDVWNGAWNDEGVTRDPERRLLGVAPVEIAGRWRYTSSTFEVLESRLRSDHSRGRASTYIRHQGTQRLSVDMDFERLDFSDLGDIAGVSLLGVGAVSGRLEGLFTDLSGRGTLSLDGISVSSTPLGQATAEVRWNGRQQVDIASIEGRIGETDWNGDIFLDFRGPVPVGLRGEIGSGQLGDLLLPLGFEPSVAAAVRGGIRGGFDLRGPVPRWTGPLSLEMEDVVVYGQSFGSGTARGAMKSGRVFLDELILTDGRRRSFAQGSLLPATTDFELAARLEGWRWPDVALARSLPVLEGDLGLRARLDGTLRRPKGDIVLDLARMRAGSVDLGQGEMTLKLARDRGDLQGSLPKAGLRIQGEVRAPTHRVPFSVRYALDNSPLPAVLAAQLGARAEGTVSLRGLLEGELAELFRTSGTVSVGKSWARWRGRRFELTSSRPLALEKGRLGLAPLRLRGEGLDVRFSRRIRLDGRADVGVRGQVGFGLLAEWVPSMERPVGRLDIEGRVLGSKDGWEFVGEAGTNGAGLGWTSVPGRFSEVAGRMTFSDDSVFVESLNGRWSGGRIGATGSVTLEDLAPAGVDFDVQLDRTRPKLDLPYLGMEGQLDGKLRVNGHWPELKVRGGLSVSRAEVRPRIDLSSLVGSRTLAAAYDPSAEIFELDIGLTFAQEMKVKNDDIDVALRGDLRLTGTNERIGLLGSLAILRGGRVSFVGREYRTEGGLIEMRERFVVAPRYDLTLSTTACSSRIAVNLIGNLSTVSTNYSSSPEMDQEDITSCLVRGFRRRDYDQELAGNVAFAGSALLRLSGVDRQVKQVIPIDQLDMTTEFSSRSRAYVPRLWVAKDIDLLDRPVRLEYSTSLLRADDQRAAFRVRLTPRLSLQLGWTSSQDVPTGDWGLDLERRWEW